MEDRDIVELYWKRNEQAIPETAAKYGAYCTKISMNILSDPLDSEENVNDTYLQAWNSIPPTRPMSLAAFLGRISRNLALNRYKARHTGKREGDLFAQALEELDVCTPSGVSVENEVELRALSRSISDFLRTESRDARDLFVCRYFYCESIDDLSRKFGFHPGKVKTMLFRTRGRLHTHLKKEGYYEK